MKELFAKTDSVAESDPELNSSLIYQNKMVKNVLNTSNFTEMHYSTQTLNNSTRFEKHYSGITMIGFKFKGIIFDLSGIIQLCEFIWMLRS